VRYFAVLFALGAAAFVVLFQELTSQKADGNRISAVLAGIVGVGSYVGFELIWRRRRRVLTDPYDQRRAQPFLRGVKMIIIASILGLGFYTQIAVSDGSGDLVFFGFAALYVAGLSTSLSLLTSRMLVITNARNIRRAVMFRSSNGLLLHELTSAVLLAHSDSERWLSGRGRRRLAMHIEKASQVLERSLRENVPLGDRVSDAWTTTQFREAAAGLRDTKRWLAFPMQDTPEHLRRRLSRTLVSAVHERWDELERQVPGRATRSSAVSAVLVVLTALFGCAIAGGGVWIYSRLRLPEPPGYLLAPIIATGVFLLVYVLASLDPQFGSKLATIKQVADTVTPFRGKRD
jgi:hypothetical protein